jgi:hypothetical protein
MFHRIVVIVVGVLLLAGCSSKKSVGEGAFLSGCVRSGGSKSQCQCLYGHLEDTYSAEQLSVLGEPLTPETSSLAQAIAEEGFRYAPMCVGK